MFYMKKITWKSKQKLGLQHTKYSIGLLQNVSPFPSMLYSNLPPLFQSSIILNIKSMFAASWPCSKHFMTLLSSKCNENLGHVVASGWNFPETSHNSLTPATSSLPTVLCFTIHNSSVVSHKVAYIHNSWSINIALELFLDVNVSCHVTVYSAHTSLLWRT